MRIKGVNYDAGRVMMGMNWRPDFDPEIVRREIEIIKQDLHCNAIRICGVDIERLMIATEYALGQGLQVWLSPELWDKTQQETLDHLVVAASAAEALRQQWPDHLVFSVGSELTLFMQGIIEGANLMERLANPSFWETIKAGAHNEVLNPFLARATASVRQVFRGPVTYASAPLETVDWRPFDYVVADLYRDERIKASYGDILRKRYLALDKPVVIGEFGCCTYRGAENAGGMAWNIVDLDKVPPQLNGDYVRDEGVQAREVTEQLDVLEEVGVEGAFVFTFVAPASPYSPIPRFDLDMASYSLVKTIREGHGTTYPEMSWEPKESFHAVADYYGNESRRAS